MESIKAVSGKPPEPSVAGLDTLERLMDHAWPALECSTADGWVLRSAGGVTQRANSIWPVSAAADTSASLTAANNWYAERLQPVIFQLTRRPENVGLETFLDTQGYSRQSETIIMTAGLSQTSADPVLDGFTVSVAEAPSSEWLDLWWSVDGRGGAAGMRTARRILAGVPSLYASARTMAGEVVGTGRVTLVAGWGGIYSMATHSDFRRRGVAAAVLAALAREARQAGAAQLWLMATAANGGAQALYGRAGFVEAGSYHYRQAPLRRAVGAC